MLIRLGQDTCISVLQFIKRFRGSEIVLSFFVITGRFIFTAMKFETAINIPKSLFLFPCTLVVVVVLIPLIRSLNESASNIYGSDFEAIETRSSCNIFSGNWSRYDKGPYYNNVTCPYIADKQNCFTNGRPDREFLQWRWKPHECELPLFDAVQFLNLVNGKSMAFVGDSIGRNQMESLLCLLSSVSHPEDITTKHISNYKDEIYFKWWFYGDYNFTVATLWSPFLVKSTRAYLNDTALDNAEKLYLDEADQAWTSQIQNFDLIIFSGGQWFFRPLTFIQNDRVIGCQLCQNNTQHDFYGYRIAFRTAFRAIINLKGFKGLTFLVTHSPNHFENGEWNKGGACNRTMPYASMEDEVALHIPYALEELHQMQVEEFLEAEKEAKKKGLKFVLMDVTDAMLMRPDGHPNKYGHAIHKNVTINDCVHWCMPGPVDTWNEFLLYLLKMQM